LLRESSLDLNLRKIFKGRNYLQKYGRLNIHKHLKYLKKSWKMKIDISKKKTTEAYLYTLQPLHNQEGTRKFLIFLKEFGTDLPCLEMP
jgi:hypothetical protein